MLEACTIDVCQSQRRKHVSVSAQGKDNRVSHVASRQQCQIQQWLATRGRRTDTRLYLRLLCVFAKLRKLLLELRLFLERPHTHLLAAAYV